MSDFFALPYALDDTGYWQHPWLYARVLRVFDQKEPYEDRPQFINVFNKHNPDVMLAIRIISETGMGSRVPYPVDRTRQVLPALQFEPNQHIVEISTFEFDTHIWYITVRENTLHSFSLNTLLGVVDW